MGSSFRSLIICSRFGPPFEPTRRYMSTLLKAGSMEGDSGLPLPAPPSGLNAPKKRP